MRFRINFEPGHFEGVMEGDYTEGLSRFILNSEYGLPNPTELQRLIALGGSGFYDIFLPGYRRYYAIFSRLPIISNLSELQQEICFKTGGIEEINLPRLTEWYRIIETIRYSFQNWAATLDRYYGIGTYEYCMYHIADFLAVRWDGSVPRIYAYLYRFTGILARIRENSVSYLDLEAKMGSNGIKKSGQIALFINRSFSEVWNIILDAYQGLDPVDFLVLMRELGYLGNVEVLEMRGLLQEIPDSLPDEYFRQFIYKRKHMLLLKLSEWEASMSVDSELRSLSTDDLIKSAVAKVVLNFYSCHGNYNVVPLESRQSAALLLARELGEDLERRIVLLSVEQAEAFRLAVEKDTDGFVIYNSHTAASTLGISHTSFLERLARAVHAINSDNLAIVASDGTYIQPASVLHKLIMLIENIGSESVPGATSKENEILQHITRALKLGGAPSISQLAERFGSSEVQLNRHLRRVVKLLQES